MIRSRPKPKIQRGPALSDDRFDKFIAAMNWRVGGNKKDPEFIRAPHYYAAVLEWFDRLSLDQQELVQRRRSGGDYLRGRPAICTDTARRCAQGVGA